MQGDQTFWQAISSGLNSLMDKTSASTAGWIEQKFSPYPAVASVTLNFKQGRQLPHGWVRITPEIVSRQISWLLTNLNRSIFGNQARRRGKKLTVVAVQEAGVLGDHLHAHLAIGIPHGILPVKIIGAVEALWGKANWGYGHNQIDLVQNLTSWSHYIAWHGSDALDTSNTFFPEPAD